MAEVRVEATWWRSVQLRRSARSLSGWKDAGRNLVRNLRLGRSAEVFRRFQIA